jgi:hypothetical protein
MAKGSSAMSHAAFTPNFLFLRVKPTNNDFNDDDYLGD